MDDKKNYCTFYIVRHGQSESNAAKIVAGHTDKPLSVDGKVQAKLRAEELSAIKFDAVFASDLMRAKQTAEIIAINHQLAVGTHGLLRERFFGKWDGRPELEFKEANKHLFEKLKTLSEADKQKFKYSDDYESNEEAATRLITFLREIAATYLGKNILIVSHGSIMRSLLMRLGFASYDELPSGGIENTGYFILESDGVDFFVKATKNITKINSIN